MDLAEVLRQADGALRKLAGLVEAAGLAAGPRQLDE
jgi:hypothetical protein